MEKVQKIDYKKILILIFILAIILRIVFISFSRIDQFQYDVGTMNLINSESYEKLLKREKEVFLENRHLDYILKIYETGRLPDTNETQLYHPPLHHIVSAIWLKIIDLTPFSTEIKLESLQIITCVYSILTLLIIYKILEELQISDKFKILVLSICSFHPMFVYMSGLINNDTMLTMFSCLSILYILKWYKNPNYKYAIILAIIIGFGTLIKSSMLVNIAIAGIAFFIKVLEKIDKQEYNLVKKIVVQGIIFFVIAIPLILSFQIRNYILFGQGFFAVHDAAEWLYVGNDDVLARFGIFNKEILNNTLKYQDQNILSYVIKSAIVFETERQTVLGTTLVKVFSMLIIIFTLIAMFKLLFSKNKINYILISGYLLWIILFISFNIQMPNSCTMHARYIITAIILSIICLAKALEESKNTNFIRIINILNICFSVTSIGIIILNII